MFAISSFWRRALLELSLRSSLVAPQLSSRRALLPSRALLLQVPLSQEPSSLVRLSPEVEEQACLQQALGLPWRGWLK